MKTERRHELKTNELADWLGKSIGRVEENYKVGLAIVVVVVLIVAVWAYLRNSAAEKMQESWAAYQRAAAEQESTQLDDVATRYADMPGGACARLLLADRQLRAGADQLFADRADANDQLRRALDNYQAVVDSRADLTPIVRQRALLGLARAAESLNDLPRAREAYQQLADTNRWPQAFYASEAQARLDALSRDSTKEFYDWFAKQEPRPALSPSLDGQSLFEDSKLPGEPTAPAERSPTESMPAESPPGEPAPTNPATPEPTPREPAAPSTDSPDATAPDTAAASDENTTPAADTPTPEGAAADISTAPADDAPSAAPPATEPSTPPSNP
ncbi:MAG: hypothetical protein AB7U73_14240 [Pirellulales bacterium]